MTNSFIDLIIRIKNGYMAQKETVVVPRSKLNEEVLKKLKSLKYIQDYSNNSESKYSFNVALNYDRGVAALTDVQVYSKPGRRYYVSYKELKPVVGGMGWSIISTPKGILTNIEAQKEKIGGELLFNIW